MAQLRLSRFMSEVSLLESNIRIPRSCVLLRFEWTRVTGAAQSRDVCVCVLATVWQLPAKMYVFRWVLRRLTLI